MMWKWVSLDELGDSFDIDCSDVIMEDLSPKKCWHRCGKHDQPKILDLKRVLNDEERSNFKTTVVICSFAWLEITIKE